MVNHHRKQDNASTSIPTSHLRREQRRTATQRDTCKSNPATLNIHPPLPYRETKDPAAHLADCPGYPADARRKLQGWTMSRRKRNHGWKKRRRKTRTSHDDKERANPRTNKEQKENNQSAERIVIVATREDHCYRRRTPPRMVIS